MAKTLFENLYSAGEGIKKALLKPTRKRELERQFQSHYDKLAEKAEKAAEEIVSEYKKSEKVILSPTLMLSLSQGLLFRMQLKTRK